MAGIGARMKKLHIPDVDPVSHLVKFLAHLAFMLMSLSNHELSVMCWHPASSSLVLFVDSHPSYRFDHRNYISCTYLYICL